MRVPAGEAHGGTPQESTEDRHVVVATGVSVKACKTAIAQSDVALDGRVVLFACIHEVSESPKVVPRQREIKW